VVKSHAEKIKSVPNGSGAGYASPVQRPQHAEGSFQMTNVASLKITVDARDIERGINALKKLETQAARTEAKVSDVRGKKSATRATMDLDTATSELTRQLNGLPPATKKASAGVNGLSVSSRKAATAANTLDKSASKAKASVAGLGSGANKASTGVNNLGGASKRTNSHLRNTEAHARRASASTYLMADAFRALRYAVAAYISIQGVQYLASVADEATNARNRLRAVTGSTEELNHTFDELGRVSTESRVSLETSANLYQRMVMGTEHLGISQSRLIRLTETINKSFKISGATADEASGSIRQLTQAFNANMLRGEELNSINEQAPVLMKAIEKETGLAGKALRDFAETGGITADIMVKAFESIEKEVDQKFGATTKTIEDRILDIRREFVLWADESDSLNATFGNLVDGLDLLGKGVRMAVDAIAPLINNVSDGIRLFGDWAIYMDHTYDIMDTLEDALLGVSKETEVQSKLIERLKRGYAELSRIVEESLVDESTYEGMLIKRKNLLEDIADVQKNDNSRSNARRSEFTKLTAELNKLEKALAKQLDTEIALANQAMVNAKINGTTADELKNLEDALRDLLKARGDILVSSQAVTNMFETETRVLTEYDSLLDRIAAKGRGQEIIAGPNQRINEIKAETAAYIEGGKALEEYQKQLKIEMTLQKEIKKLRQADILVNEEKIASLRRVIAANIDAKAARAELNALLDDENAKLDENTIKKLENEKAAMANAEALIREAEARQRAEDWLDGEIARMMKEAADARAKAQQDEIADYEAHVQKIESIYGSLFDALTRDLGAFSSSVSNILNSTLSGTLAGGGFTASLQGALSAGMPGLMAAGFTSVVDKWSGGSNTDKRQALDMLMPGLFLGTIGETLGINFGGQPSDKTQAMQANLATGGFTTSGLTGKKFSEENEAAAAAGARVAAALAGVLEDKIGGPIAETLEFIVGNREGVRARLNGELVASGRNFGEVLAELNDELASLAGIDPAPYREVARENETLLDTMVRLEGQFNFVNNAFDLIGLNAVTAGTEGEMFADSLIKAAGGMEQLASNVDFYYKNFFTETEQLEKTIDTNKGAISEFNKEFGAQIGDTASLRAYIEGLDDTSDAYDENLARALALAPAVHNLATAQADLTSIKQTGMTVDEQIAEKEKQRQATAQEAERQAQEAERQAANAASERYNLETQLLQVEGNTQALRERHLATLDPTNRALQEQIWATEDAADAENALTKAREEADRVAEARARELEQANKAAGSTLMAEINSEASKAVSNVTESVIDPLELVDARFTILESSISAREDALRETYEKHVESLRATFESDIEAINAHYNSLLDNLRDNLDSVNEKVRVLADISGMLANAVDEVARPVTLQDRQAAQARLFSSLDMIRSGADISRFNLNDDVRTITQDSTKLFTNFADFALSQARSRVILEGLKEEADSQLSTAEKQLNALNTSLELAESQHEENLQLRTAQFDAALAQAETQHTEQLDALKAILTQAEEQINVLKGIETNTTVETAKEKLDEALKAADSQKAEAGAVANFDGSFAADLNSKEMFRINELIRKRASIKPKFETLPTLTTMPGFASGTNSTPPGAYVVGENGPEIMNVPNASIDSNKDFSTFLAELREEVRRGNFEMIKYLKRSYEIADNWDVNGIPAERA